MYPLHTVSNSVHSVELTQRQRTEHNDAVFAHNNRPYDTSQELWDGRFILLDNAEFMRAFNFAVSNPTFRSGTDIIQNEITRGGLHVQHGSGVKQLRAEEMDHRIPWLNIAITMLMDYFIYGISLWQAVTDEHSGHIDMDTGKKQRKPKRIDPLKVNIYYHHPISGDPLFHVRQPPDLMHDGTMFPVQQQQERHQAGRGTKRKYHDEDDQKIAFRGRELFDVMIFWGNNLDLPDPLTGRLRSRVTTLVSLYTELEMLNQCAIEAAMRASNPALVTEHSPDSKAAQVTVDGLVPYGGSLTLGQGVDLASLDAQIRQDILIDRAMKIKDARQATGDWMTVVNTAKMMAKGAATAAGPRIDLGPERKVARTEKAEAPKELYKRALMTQAETLQVLGIPAAMVMAEHTGGKQGAGNVNAERIYRQNIYALKSKIMGPLKTLYKCVYPEQRAKDIMSAGLKHKDKLDAKDKKGFRDAVQKETEIEFILPAIPNLEEIKQIYADGLLKPEFMPLYISMNTGVPLSHMYDKPQTSRLDMQTEGKASLQKEAGKQEMTKSAQDHKQTMSQNKQSAGLQDKEHKRTMEEGKLQMQQETLKMKHTALKQKKAAADGAKKKKPKKK